MLSLIDGPRKRVDSGQSGVWTTGGIFPMPRVRTSSGIPVDEQLGLTLSAVWACTKIVVEPIAGMPRVLYRHTGNDGREVATDNPLYELIDVAPNPSMGAVPFWEGRVTHQVNSGNGFAEIERSRNKIPALWPIHWSRVFPTAAIEPAKAADFPYAIRNNDNSITYAKSSEILHLAGSLPEDGIWGKGVIPYAREEIGLGLAARRHGAGYFASGGMPKMVAVMPGMQDPEKRRQYRSEWKEVHNSDNPGELAIIPSNSTLTPVTIPNDSGQYLETTKQNRRTIASYYRVPPYMIGEHDEGAAARASIEAQGIEFVIYTLMPWIRKIECELNLKCLTREERKTLFIEHKLAGLVRGDLKGRMEAYRIALAIGLMTINEARRLENWPALPAYADEPYMQMNMATVRSIWDGTALASPPPANDVAAEDVPEPTTATAGGFDQWTKQLVARSVQLRNGGKVRRQSRTLAVPTASEVAAAGSDPENEEPTLIDVPDRRQTGDYDCGAAATHSVADYFAVGGDRVEQDYIDELNTTREGTTTEAIVDWFNDAGLIVTSGPGMHVDDLREFCEADRPVICPIQIGEDPAGTESGHYVVVIGVALGQVFYQNPLTGRQMMPIEEFNQRWHDTDRDDKQPVDHFGLAVGRGVPSPAAPTDAEPSPADPADAAALDLGPLPTAVGVPIQSDALRAACRNIFVDVLGRMFTKEVNAIRRELKNPDFPACLEEFHEKHRAVLAGALGSAVQMSNALGSKASADAIAGEIVALSQKELAAAAATDTPAQMEQRLADWPTNRPAWILDHALAGDW